MERDRESRAGHHLSSARLRRGEVRRVLHSICGDQFHAEYVNNEPISREKKRAQLPPARYPTPPPKK